MDTTRSIIACPGSKIPPLRNAIHLRGSYGGQVQGISRPLFKGGEDAIALGLDFSPDFERICREFSPLEINQIADPEHPSVGVEYLDFDSLSEFVEFLKQMQNPQSSAIQENQASDSSFTKGASRIIFLTKQPAVVEKFCAENEIEAEVWQWKMGGPSFIMREGRKGRNEENEGMINGKFENGEEIPNPHPSQEFRTARNDQIPNKSQGPNPNGKFKNLGIDGRLKIEDGRLEEEDVTNHSSKWQEYQSTIVITDELLGPLLGGVFRRKKAPQLDLLVQIRVGDPVVHLFHGVGIFRGIVRNVLSGVEREYMELEYAEGDKLFVPVDELHRVSKYVGESSPTLTRLGTPAWNHVLAKTNEEVRKIAEELIANHAARRIAGGVSMPDFPDKEETFHLAFEYTHTADQEQAIQSIMADMSSVDPMDRLLSGDVGFGKTEVSLHAVYRAFLNHKQTIFLAPLVVLAYEHFEAIRERVKPFGLTVALLTRMSTSSEEKAVLKGLKEGTIHCVIGTHRLLSPDIKFADLGLVVIDEEHKFGVSDKEKILKLKSGVDTLALSATPIPRSLNLALSGVKHFSILATPPVGKKPIHTLIARYDTGIIKRAIEEELARGGKVFFVHNTIESLPVIQREIEKLVKGAKVVITNGQLPSDQLEDRIMEFKLGMHNVLLTTTVIENGINFYDTNTIIIDEAEDFGLAQLHQLRGRVGRGPIQGICYLLYRQPELADDARERLMTIANHTHLGAGFEIALRDMEIRGVGDVLGVRQSGRTKDVGVSFYLKLLEQAVTELQSGKKAETVDTTIDLPMSAFVPDEIFSSDIEKIHFYRELESVREVGEVDELQKIVTDRFADNTIIDNTKKDNTIIRGGTAPNRIIGLSNYPVSVSNLFLLVRARLVCSHLGIRRVHMQLGKYTIEWGGEGKHTLDAMRTLLARDTNKCAEVLSGKKMAFPRKAFINHAEFLRFLIGTN